MPAKGRPPAQVDWLIDAEIALYRSRGWTWEQIAAYFGMCARTAQRRYDRYRNERGVNDG